MTAPSLIQYAETTIWTSSANRSTGTSITWLSGDVILVVAGMEAGTDTVSTPTAAGLSFSAISGAVSGTSGSYCWANAWVATPGAGGTQPVAATSSGTPHWGMGVWVWRGSAGIGNVAASGATANTNLTISLVRSGTNSCVAGGGFDWSAVIPTGYSFTPTVGHDRQHVQDGSGYTVYVADWGDQGTAGTTSYGISGVTTGVFTKLFIEVKGTASAGATVTMGSALTVAAAQPAPLPGSLSGPSYATAAAILGGGTGTWANPGNADNVPDGSYATWTVT